jgi:glyoxylate utilization-related uncharacterized protein
MAADRAKRGPPFFISVPGNRSSQAAEMVLARGSPEGGADNRHRGADQCLFVLSGRGEALIDGRRHKLARGALVFIERRERTKLRTPAAHSCAR